MMIAINARSETLFYTRHVVTAVPELGQRAALPSFQSTSCIASYATVSVPGLKKYRGSACAGADQSRRRYAAPSGPRGRAPGGPPKGAGHVGPPGGAPQSFFFLLFPSKYPLHTPKNLKEKKKTSKQSFASVEKGTAESFPPSAKSMRPNFFYG